MDYQEFLESVKQQVQSLAKEGEVIRLHTVLKNNNIRMKALSMQKKGQEASPLIYMMPFYRMYKNGKKIEEIASELVKLCNMGELPSDYYVFLSLGSAKPHIAWRLIHYDENRELLEQIPHKRLLDFAVIYYLSLSGKKENECASAIIYKEH